MFTGIITDIGEVVAREDAGTEARFRIRSHQDPQTVAIGASIAHDGVCLTVVERGMAAEGGMWHEVVASAETLCRTTMGDWREGRRINLERALKVGDELGGHIVSGHVDGIGRIVAIEPIDDSRIFTFEVPEEIARFIAPKGSIALNGTSLTVNTVSDCHFTVNLIPHTLAVTTWGRAEVGDPVNVEIDMLARYLARLVEFSGC